MARKITPLRGSPTGKVVFNNSETHEWEVPTIPDEEFGEEVTVCSCGLPFPDHNGDELAYIHEYRRCKRLSRIVR